MSLVETGVYREKLLQAKQRAGLTYFTPFSEMNEKSFMILPP
jgi:hypothetical protein